MSIPRQRLLLLLLTTVALLGGVLVWLTKGTNPGVRLLTTLDVPGTMTNGMEQDFSVTVENQGDRPAEQTMLSLTGMTGFTVLSTTKTPAVGKPDDLQLGTLRPHARVVINVHGRVLDTNDAKREIIAEADFRTHNLPLRTKQVKAAYTVHAPDLRVTMDMSARAESTVPFSITVRLKNQTTATFQNVQVAVTLPNDLALLQTTPTAAQSTQPATWTLAALSAGKEVTIVLTAVANTSTDQSASIQVSVQKDTATLQSTQQTLLLAAAPTAATLIHTTGDTVHILRFAAEAHYTSTAGIQFGYGPVPPKVGKTTGYRIFWTLGLPGRPFAGVTVKATLPANVAWAGNVSATAGTTPVFDPVSRIITWPVGEITADQTGADASFDVRITPQKDDTGKTMRLLEPTRLTATENGQPVTRLTTVLSTSTPELAFEKGIVTE